MSLYTKARRHIDMNRVKELREEKIKKEKIAEIQKQQEEILAELAEIEKEESKYVNWRKELNEMTTADLAYVTLAAEGDVDLVPTTDNIVNGNFSFEANWSASNGVATSADSSELIIPGATSTVFRRADMKIPVPADKNISTVKVTVSKGGGTVSWTDRDPSENFDADLYLNVNGGAGYQSLSDVQSGVYTFTIDPKGHPTVPGFVFVNFGQFAKINATGQTTVKISFQRRTPVNVFVSLDDPVASAFVRDGDFDRLSNAEKKKKLEEQLRSSDEYLNKMFGEGMPKGATTIADTEPQQSFADIALDTIPYEPPSPGPGGYKRPGSYDPSKFFEIPTNHGPQFPSPNLPQTGPGRSSVPDGTEVAASYPTTNTPLDKVGGFKGIPKGKGWYPMDKDGNLYNPQTGLPIKKAGKKSKPKTVVAHHELKGKVIKEKKSFKDLTKKIPGYYDGKPSPLGFPVEEPPKMKNGFHPDFVSGKKVANRFNRLDPQSAKAMPKTGNSHVDKKVRAAAKKPK